MKLLVFSDIRTIKELPNEAVDLVVLLGGIPSKIVHRIDRQYDCYKVGLLSNHCHPSLYDDTSIINLHEKIIEVEGLNIAGFGGVPFYDEEEPYGQFKETDVKNFIKRLQISDVKILLSYSNMAYGDINAPLANSGFKSYSHIIMDEVVSYLIHGRMEYPSVRKLGSVMVHSVYPYSLIEI